MTTATKNNAPSIDERTHNDMRSAASSCSFLREELTQLCQEANERLRSVHDRYDPLIQSKAAEVNAADNSLLGLVRSAAHLFTRPRSLKFAGIRYGWLKGKGATVISDKAKAIAAIEAYCDEQGLDPTEAGLITYRPTINKDALANLAIPPKTLKQAGITIVNAAEEPFVRDQETEATALAKAILSQSKS